LGAGAALAIAAAAATAISFQAIFGLPYAEQGCWQSRAADSTADGGFFVAL
jgi:hypothetical protein